MHPVDLYISAFAAFQCVQGSKHFESCPSVGPRDPSVWSRRYVVHNIPERRDVGLVEVHQTV